MLENIENGSAEEIIARLEEERKQLKVLPLPLPLALPTSLQHHAASPTLTRSQLRLSSLEKHVAEEEKKHAKAMQQVKTSFSCSLSPLGKLQEKHVEALLTERNAKAFSEQVAQRLEHELLQLSVNQYKKSCAQQVLFKLPALLPLLLVLPPSLLLTPCTELGPQETRQDFSSEYEKLIGADTRQSTKEDSILPSLPSLPDLSRDLVFGGGGAAAAAGGFCLKPPADLQVSTAREHNCPPLNLSMLDGRRTAGGASAGPGAPSTERQDRSRAPRPPPRAHLKLATAR
eukprot:768479-Hanusia_phi.AAC.2